MSSNPFSTVWASYSATKDCFQIAIAANKHPNRDDLFVKANDLRPLSQVNVKQAIEQGKKETDELFVLDIWAAFERFARIYLQEKGKKLQEISPASLASSMYVYFEKEVEFWKAEDILDLLKSTLAPRAYLIGQAKQVLQYRDWIAHGKKPSKTPTKITPFYAFDILNEIVELMLLN